MAGDTPSGVTQSTCIGGAPRTSSGCWWLVIVILLGGPSRSDRPCRSPAASANGVVRLAGTPGKIGVFEASDRAKLCSG